MSEFRPAQEQSTASPPTAQRPTAPMAPAVERPVERTAAAAWAGGFTIFAGVMMLMIGVFHALLGLAAVVKQNFYVVSTNYLFKLDVTAWGWIHLALGVLVALSGSFVLGGAVWARAVGITLAGLSALGNFLFIPYYPLWSMLIIAIDILVIWSLAVYGRSTAYGRGAADATRRGT